VLYLNFLNFEIILDLQESCKNSNEKFEIKRLLGRKSMCQHPTMLKAKASFRILVQLAHHTHSLTLSHANESLTFVSCFHLAFAVVLKAWTFAGDFLTGRHKLTVPREEGRG